MALNKETQTEVEAEISATNTALGEESVAKMTYVVQRNFIRMPVAASYLATFNALTEPEKEAIYAAWIASGEPFYTPPES